MKSKNNIKDNILKSMFTWLFVLLFVLLFGYVYLSNDSFKILLIVLIFVAILLVFGCLLTILLLTYQPAFIEKSRRERQIAFNENLRRKRRKIKIEKLVVTKPILQLGVSEVYKSKKNSQPAELMIEDDYFMLGNLIFYPDEIQWFGRNKDSNLVQIDVKVNDEWYLLNITLDEDTLDEFLNCVPEKLKRSHYIYRPEVRTYIGKKAHTTTQNLQGVFEKHEAVELHVTPLWVVVFHNGHVMQQHFIDNIADIRSTKHPTDLDDDMQLLTFVIGEEAFAYALKDKTFVTRLSDATKEGIDSKMMRKKKKQQTS